MFSLIEVIALDHALIEPMEAIANLFLKGKVFIVNNERIINFKLYALSL